MMTDGIEFNTNPSSDVILRQKQIGLEAGWLGHVFGTGKNAPIGIAGLVIVLLFVFGLAVLIWPLQMSATEYWKLAVPIITLALGYLFGRGGNSV